MLHNDDLFQLPAPRRCTILQGNLLGSPKCADSGHVFLFTIVILFEPEVTQHQQADLLFTALLNRLRIGIMMGDDVQFLNTTRFGAPAAGSRRRNPQHSCGCGTAGPTAAPDCSCLEPPMGMVALCFENSTASIINDIVCRAAAEADGRVDYRIVAQMGGHVAIYRWPNASCSCQIRTSTSTPSCKTGTRERPRSSPPTSACPSGLATAHNCSCHSDPVPRNDDVYANRGFHGGRLHRRPAGQLHAEVHRTPGPRRPGTQPSNSRADGRPFSLHAPADPSAFRYPVKPSIHHHVRGICLQLRCGMTGKEQHLQLPQSLISTKCCCNSRSTTPLARIVLAGHKGQGKTWPVPS